MPTSLQLRLIPSTAPQPVQAGFLPGSDVAAWLEEMARHQPARFFVVPDSVDHADAGGLLVLPGNGLTESMKFGPRVVPCLLEHGSVAVPSGTRLDPQLTAEEARRLLTYSVYFFHPVIGLVAFDAADAISPESLIVPPLPRATSWMRAMPGHSALPPLSRVMLTLPADLEDMFGNAGDEIGSLNPRDLQRKAPLTERLRDKLSSAAAGIGAGLLMGIGGLARMFGAGRPDPKQPPPIPGAKSPAKGSPNIRGIPLLDRLQKWTAKQFEKLQRQRESEIQRLLKLLETNPELGLRYALPLGSGGDASRGQAPPSGRLGQRNPTFGARRGSGPADVWNFSDQTRWTLQQKYRDLANRELAEGRFDRAAYIFAELLGDWHAAAGALARGRRHQEAARIYADKLHNKPLAAKCLEDGGLLADAVLIYAELAQHEKCGDLLRQLGREREAVAAYQESLKNSTDRLHDARILFDKLHQHSLAIAVLASGYPHSPQARPCLEKHFEYLTRLNATSDALALATVLADPARQMPQATAMAETLHAVHRTHPDPEVQERLSIAALGVIGTALTRSSDKERRLLELLPNFAPSDRLLKRDASRHLDHRERLNRPQKKPSSTPGNLALTRKQLIHLPQEGIKWWHMISRGNAWLAYGEDFVIHQLVYVMGEGEKPLGRLASGPPLPTALAPIFPALPNVAWLPCAEQDEKSARYGQARNADFSFAPRDPVIPRISWMPVSVLAIHAVAEGVWIVHRNRTETIDLSFYTYQGQLIRTHALGWAPPDLAVPVNIATHDEEVFISAGLHLLHVKHGHIGNQMELPLRILHLEVTKPTQPAAVLTVTGNDVTLIAPGKKNESIQLFSSSNGDCKACFLADGRIAVGDETGGLIYSAYPHAQLISSIPPSRDQRAPLAAYAAWGDNGLAMLRTDGRIECLA